VGAEGNVQEGWATDTVTRFPNSSSNASCISHSSDIAWITNKPDWAPHHRARSTNANFRQRA